MRRPVVVLLVLLLSGPPSSIAAGQDPQPAPSTTAAPVPPDPPPVDVSELPISVDRIERQLGKPAPIRFQVTQPMFRVEIVERRPKWFADIEWLPDYDPSIPMPSGPSWHRDFLTMVTPETAMPFGQSTGVDLLQLMATSLVEGMTTKSLAQKIKAARANRRAAEARAEVDAAIEAWKQEREEKAAGQAITPP